MKKFSTVFSVSFTVEHDVANPEVVPGPSILAGLERRIAYLNANPEELEAAISWGDTVNLEEHTLRQAIRAELQKRKSKADIVVSLSNSPFVTPTNLQETALRGYVRFVSRTVNRRRFVSPVRANPTHFDLLMLANAELNFFSNCRYTVLTGVHKLAPFYQKQDSVTDYEFEFAGPTYTKEQA
jgi:hypothetical protein